MRLWHSSAALYFTQPFQLRSFLSTTPSQLRSLSNENLYNLLGVSRKASREEIKSAFITLSKKHHPDLNPPSKSKESNEEFRKINEAYTILMDPAKRSEYDQQYFYYSSNSPSPDDGKFGLYKYNPQTSAYEYARAYNYYDLSEAEWQDLYRKSGVVKKKSHVRILWWLFFIMISGTALHTFRIYHTHKNHQLQSKKESKKNQELYNAVRERGRTSTLQQQLDRLTQDHKLHLEAEETGKPKDSRSTVRRP